MRIASVVIILFFLVSCVPVPEQPKTPEIKEGNNENIASANLVEPEIPVTVKAAEATKYVVQVFSDKSVAKYGFDDSGEIALIENSKKTVISYDDSGNIAGIGDIKLEYEDNLLRKAINGDEVTLFEYSNGKLAKVKNKKESVTFTYDIAGTLAGVEKDANPITALKYDENNNINEIEKSGAIFKLYYDDKGKLKDIDMRDNHIIIGRGRESRLVSLSGSLYGQGEMFDYMDDRIKIISSISSEFTGPDDLRIKAFNLYLICTRIKQLDVIFDVAPYAIVRNYFGMDPYSYVINNYFCEAFR